MQKFRFQDQFEGKSLENSFGPSVKIQDGCQLIASFLSHYPS